MKEGDKLTTADLKAIVDKYGDRICSISFDNGSMLLFGYGNGSGSVPSVKDIQYEKFGETEMFSVPHIGTSTRPTYTFRTHHNPEGIRAINVIDAEHEDYRIDPMFMR